MDEVNTEDEERLVGCLFCLFFVLYCLVFFLHTQWSQFILKISLPIWPFSPNGRKRQMKIGNNNKKKGDKAE